ncbi:MAG TPA: alpha/beta hydrolase-fold protein [Terriglobia bacterium]
MCDDIGVKITGLTTALLIFTAAVTAGAQGRGGAPRGGGGGAGNGPRASTIERVTVHGKALEGNLEGDSPDRQVAVYLPPSYAADPARQFPVVYFLHDYGTHSNPIDQIKEFADRYAAMQGFSEPVVVVPDAYTLHKGSMYSSSVTTGDWESFVAEDLVGYIDTHYRTLAKPISRGLAGYSMGGYGALRIAMTHPGVFSSLYIMSACCLSAMNPTPDAMLPASPSDKEMTMAAAAAWSPDPNNPPLFLDLPASDGKTRPDIAGKWAANSILTMLEQYASTLKKYYSIAIETGTKDPFIASNKQLHEAMVRLGIPHAFEAYDGDHTNMLNDRIERNLIPFFSKNLAAPANPTSPGVH